jgi:hypothetical protein
VLITHLNAKARAEESREVADALKHLESEVILPDPQVRSEELVPLPTTSHQLSPTDLYLHLRTKGFRLLISAHPNSRRRRKARTTRMTEHAAMTAMITAVRMLSGSVRRVEWVPSPGSEVARLLPRMVRSS